VHWRVVSRALEWPTLQRVSSQSPAATIRRTNTATVGVHRQNTMPPRDGQLLQPQYKWNPYNRLCIAQQAWGARTI